MHDSLAPSLFALYTSSQLQAMRPYPAAPAVAQLLLRCAPLCYPTHGHNAPPPLLRRPCWCCCRRIATTNMYVLHMNIRTSPEHTYVMLRTSGLGHACGGQGPGQLLADRPGRVVPCGTRGQPQHAAGGGGACAPIHTCGPVGACVCNVCARGRAGGREGRVGGWVQVRVHVSWQGPEAAEVRGLGACVSWAVVAACGGCGACGGLRRLQSGRPLGPGAQAGHGQHHTAAGTTRRPCPILAPLPRTQDRNRPTPTPSRGCPSLAPCPCAYR